MNLEDWRGIEETCGVILPRVPFRKMVLCLSEFLDLVCFFENRSKNIPIPILYPQKDGGSQICDGPTSRPAIFVFQNLASAAPGPEAKF